MVKDKEQIIKEFELRTKSKLIEIPHHLYKELCKEFSFAGLIKRSFCFNGGNGFYKILKIGDCYVTFGL